MPETTLGDYKFPDGTVQTTAGTSFVTHDASLAGLGTAASPLSGVDGLNFWITLLGTNKLARF